MEAFAIVCSRRAREPGDESQQLSSRVSFCVCRAFDLSCYLKIMRLKRRHTTTTRPALVPAAPVQASAAAPTSNHAPAVGSRRLGLR